MKHSVNGWPTQCLADVADIASGVAKGRRLEGPTVMVPYLRVANVQAGHLDLSEIKEIEVLASEVDKYRLQVGDILMTEGGDRDKLGRGTVWRGQIEPCIHQNHVFRVRPEVSRLVPEFLNYYMQTPTVKTYFLRCAKQTTGIASINRTQLSGLPVLLPPVAQQQRIAAILDKADGIRRKRWEALAIATSLIQATFYDVFGDMREETSRWPVVVMQELFAVSPIFGTMEVPVDEPTAAARWLDIRVINIQDGKLDLTSRKYVALPADMIHRHVVQDGDLLLARAIGSPEHLGKCIVARPNGEKWAFDSHLMRARFRADLVEPDFVHGFLNSPTGRQEFLRHSRRSAVQYNINTKEFSEIRIPLPRREVQASYLKRLRQIQQIEQRQRQGADELDAVFGSLVQQAFRGEL